MSSTGRIIATLEGCNSGSELLDKKNIFLTPFNLKISKKHLINLNKLIYNLKTTFNQSKKKAS